MKRTLSRVARAAKNAAEARAELLEAMRAAQAEGATLRELAAVTGYSPEGVRKMLREGR